MATNADCRCSCPMQAEMDTVPERISSTEAKWDQLHAKADEIQDRVSKVHTPKARAGFASRDKDAAVEALTGPRQENGLLILPQNHWEDFRRANERLSQLAALVSQSQMNELELTELRRVRAHHGVEGRTCCPTAPLQRARNEHRKQRSRGEHGTCEPCAGAAARSRMGATGERVRGVARGRAAGARAGGGPRGAARREGRRGAPCKGPRGQTA